MDKDWMKMVLTVDGRISQSYFDGVSSFIQFARAVIDGQGNIRCPCLKCVNFYQICPEDVRIHLLQNGIMQSYTIWHEHGEPRVSDNIPHSEMRDKQYHDIGGIDALVEDRIRAESTNVTQGEEMRNFQKLLKDSQRELYPGSKEYTLLKFVIEAFNMKVSNHWTNKSFNLFLKFQNRVLPKCNLVPNSTYEARKILSDLGLSYELIDACINDCVLFWKENAMLDRCPRCNVSRYKINCGKGKKIPHKILRYFPLTPRLKRLFMSRMISEAMRWHMENPSDGEESRHPAHSDEWKDFDIKHPEFALEPRNVRLGLAVDGFNPFGNMSNSYSMWPVILVPYNLPPWLAMKDSFFMLTLLVPGDKQPGIDIDVYMRPMMDEFKELWQTGALTYDAFGRESFQMHATLLWTVHDWPAFGDISGKTAYINHRCYLPENHPERRKKAAYNGKQEKRKRSLELQVEKIQEQLNNINEVILGKYPTNKKRSRHEPNWTKRSILYELPYFKDKKFRHNIDVMHGEKNFCENLVGTMLGIDGKNKDTDKARKDLEDKGIRKELWLTQQPNGSYVKPRASFSLTIEEKEAFFKFLKSVKYPDGYAANISRSIHSTNGRLIGLKSHDYHILIQQILPIRMRGFVNKEISTTLFELGNFFQDLCSKTLRRSKLEKLEERIVHILCKLEKIFPPAFFDVMVHLAIHLPCEALLGGPVQYRWMYPFERFLGALKKFVSNRARPEGSIAEAYIVKESKVKDGEPSNHEDNSEAFQQESITSALPIDIEDNIRYHREDVEVEIIERVGPFNETREDNTYDEDDEDHEIMGENINNEVGDDDEIPDADDMDPDMDYDM
ncbi:potassium transporter family protein [Actinidia rufa]|uniref:Potassium transporter family protein n=1 Tax=Actinidia rufa TaxID=165716 RepID=A0A7J0DMF0_9ERIC|nr:potassium transporter family protein [Actinidia rufa]